MGKCIKIVGHICKSTDQLQNMQCSEQPAEAKPNLLCGPKNDNFLSHIMRFFIGIREGDTDAQLCSWSGGYGPWKFGGGGGAARSDHPGSWFSLEESASAPTREGPETLSLVVSSLLQTDLESLWSIWECFCVEVNVPQQLVVSQPWGEKNLIFCYKYGTTKVNSVFVVKQLPLIDPEPAGFLSSSVKVTCGGCCDFNAPCSAWLRRTNKPLASSF